VTIEQAVDAVAGGDVVGLPTDTVYGIGVDPLNQTAVGKLFELKGRPQGKPVGLLASDLAQAESLGVITGEARALAMQFWPGALTLVVTPRVVLADWVGDAQLATVGIRVPDHPIAGELLSRTGPMAVTSANASGRPETTRAEEARVVFGDRVAVYLEGECPGGEASTVIDTTGQRLIVLRQGPVHI
jgi:L-threonylcarbamoyladenylate synthase